jgi:hypothetical protein
MQGMDAFIVVGNANTRKSSVVRSLSGCFNRSVRDIQPVGGAAPLRVYARVGSLQETRKSAEEFMAEVERMRCAAVLCCLLPSADPNHPLLYPEAQDYITRFKAAGWRIRSIAVLGQNGGGLRSPNLRQFPLASTLPINLTARAVRLHFGWE